MAGNLQPLDEKFAIVDENGKPTLYFIKWAQQRQIDIQGAITEEQFNELLAQYLLDHQLQEGSGIQITPSGNIADSPTIAADVQEILDQITSTQGSIIYRNASDWVALTPGTSGHFLKTQGAGADPVWAAVGGGGGAVSLIETQTLTAISTFSLETLAGGAYKSLLIEIEGQFSVDGANLNGTIKLNGAYKTAANYRRHHASRSSSGATNSNNSGGAASFLLTDTGATWGVGNAAGEGMRALLTFINPYNTVRQKYAEIDAQWIAPSGSFVGTTDAGFSYDGTDFASALQGVKFDTSSGTFTGVANVYGNS